MLFLIEIESSVLMTVVGVIIKCLSLKEMLFFGVVVNFGLF